ncbi:hypothetical protein [Desulfosporosinus youngiae]|uniref:Uncharacterized protein n=1 Tax=Desulfosporosinus youngiae DSM 17734 TaxID=768710 RepID=H5XUH9_9FIRM|nr:hypothetical protein [Desulfosporosinus youngiae]EHQ88997.1 hypothetical protein DesyoDRAFT_1877 [Desulfosporosinus youngiae DSM 17734]
MNNDFLLRIKDVTLCLIAANKYDILLGRLEIQKIIYLVDSMSAYLFVLSGKNGHQTYFYGPYDKNIQNALDALTIRDITETKDIKIVNKSITCNYCLTESGLAWTKNMLKESESICHRAKIADGVIYSLVKRNLLNQVKELVYAEPVYLNAKRHGYYYNLNIACENIGHSYLSLLEHYLRTNDNQMDINFATDMYIDYLSMRNEILLGSTGGNLNADKN